MDIKDYLVIKVLDNAGNYYNNAYVENDHDAIQVFKFYNEVLGYSVQLWKGDTDITSLVYDTTVVSMKLD